MFVEISKTHKKIWKRQKKTTQNRCLPQLSLEIRQQKAPLFLIRPEHTQNGWLSGLKFSAPGKKQKLSFASDLRKQTRLLAQDSGGKLSQQLGSQPSLSLRFLRELRQRNAQMDEQTDQTNLIVLAVFDYLYDPLPAKCKSF